MRSRVPNGVLTASNAIEPTTVTDIGAARVAASQEAGTASTGHGAMCSSRWVTLPSSRPARAVWPLVPDHDQVRALFLGDLGNRMRSPGHAAMDDFQRNRQSLPLELGDLLGDLRLALVLIGGLRKRPSGAGSGHVFDGMDSQHRRASLRTKGFDELERAVG